MTLLQMMLDAAREAVVEFFRPIARLWVRYRLWRLNVQPETATEFVRLYKRLQEAGVRNVHFSWAPGAEKLTSEERAREINRFLDAMERGQFVPIDLSELEDK